MLYNLGERFAMEKWWSGAYCVRYLKTYQAMPTRYKVLDLNLILSPLVVTVVAFYYHAVRHVGWIWPWLPLLYWFAYAMNVSCFVHGYIAQRRGISPSPQCGAPNLKQERSWLIAFGAVIGGLVLLDIAATLYFSANHHKIDLADLWVLSLLLLVLFIQQLWEYVRHRFWDAVVG
ncbi:MAG TPA: hypothetical protein VFC37_09245 [Terracidiphilus sp.]|jgi:hypothetical protein|nr:hypothetical protein [Terracidiphilus sp.]